MLVRVQDQGYRSAVQLGSKAFNYVTNVIMQTAIRVIVLTLL
jgi:hypothetical protein